MAYIYKTISGTDEATLMTRNENFINKPFYASILLTNTHATDSVNVDLYLVTFDAEPKDTRYFRADTPGWKCTSHADCSFGCCDSYGMCGGSKPCGDDDDDPESTVPELSYSDSVGRENIYDEIPETTKDVTPRTITETAYYILKGVTIPLGVSLKLEEEDVMFKISEYELRIKLSAGDSDVDVMIDLTNNKFTDDEYIY